MFMFVTTRKIRDLGIYNDFLALIVTGRLGVGKSTYCLKVVHQYYKERGMEDNDAWNEALKSIKFTPEEIVTHYRKHSRHNRAEITIFDDASAYLSGKQWFVDMKNIIQLEQLLTVGRLRTKALLINCPISGNLMGFLQNMECYRGHVKRVSGNKESREIDVKDSYTYWNKAKTKQLRGWRYNYTDKFSAHLPIKVFNKYEEIRDNYINIILEQETENNV